MLEKKRSETRLKKISYVEISQKLMFTTHILSSVSFNKYGYIDMKTIYRGEPKDRNIETEQMIYRHTERVDSIRKDKVERRLK